MLFKYPQIPVYVCQMTSIITPINVVAFLANTRIWHLLSSLDSTTKKLPGFRLIVKAKKPCDLTIRHVTDLAVPRFYKGKAHIAGLCRESGPDVR